MKQNEMNQRLWTAIFLLVGLSVLFFIWVVKLQDRIEELQTLVLLNYERDIALQDTVLSDLRTLKASTDTLILRWFPE